MGLPALPSMMAIWLIGMMGKSTSRQVLGRFGSEKSTVSIETSRLAFTAAPIFSVSSSFFDFNLTFAMCLYVFEISMNGTATSSSDNPPCASVGYPPELRHLRRPSANWLTPCALSKHSEIGGDQWWALAGPGAERLLPKFVLSQVACSLLVTSVNMPD